LKGGKAQHSNLKLLKGTLRKDRENPEAPELEATLPNAPAGLSPRATEWFGRITARLQAINCASSTNTEMLALLASRLTEIEECEVDIEKYGRVYETKTIHGERMVKGNPAVAQRSEAMRHTQSLLAEFGLSLATIGKIRPVSAGPKSSWSKFA
jgi:P27 family predicted phage terminase small subunit